MRFVSGANAMSVSAISSRLNRAYHRIAARALARNGPLLCEARSVTEAWRRSNPYPPAFVTEWTELLAKPLPVIRQTVVGRNRQGERLRSSSPFVFIPSTILCQPVVERLWRFIAFNAMRILERSEYDAFARHLKKLGQRDRVQRFGLIVDDEWIDGFVRPLANDMSTIIIGHFDQSLGLDGAAQVSLVDRLGERFADFGVSVIPEARHRGIGYHLLQRGLCWARAHGATRVWSLCAPDNVEMRSLGRQQNISTSILEGSCEARIDPQPLTVGNLAREMLDDFTGEWDYRSKAHKVAFSVMAGNGFMHEVRTHEFIRLVQLAALGRMDVITEYILLFRFALVQYGATARQVAQMLEGLHEDLKPLVSHDPDLLTLVRGLPSSRDSDEARTTAAGATAERQGFRARA